MAQRNEKVFERVRQELSENPDLGSRELYEFAQGVDKAISQDTLQQFHARYVLPIKRERSRSGGGGGRGSRAVESTPARRRGRPPAAEREASQQAEQPEQPEQPAGRRGRRKSAQTSDQGSSGPLQGVSASRDQVRSVLLQFAQELTDAESRSSLVQVLGRVDSYVDRIVPSGS